MTLIVSFDGASGSGKSSLAQQLANSLGFDFLPSGILYRMVAYWDSLGYHIADMPFASLLTDFSVKGNNEVLWRRKELSAVLSATDLGQKASILAQNPEVRLRLLAVQRAWPHLNGMVAEGRDMGTVIFPEATIKFYVSSALELRAMRRLEQLLALGIRGRLDEVRKEITMRDQRDERRDAAPLRVPQGAIMWENDLRPIHQQVEKMVILCKKHFEGHL